MFSLKTLLTPFAVIAATLCGACDFNVSYSANTAGITANELTEAMNPVIEQWRSGDPETSIAVGAAKPNEVRWTSQKRWKEGSQSYAKLGGWAQLSDGTKTDLSADLRNTGRGWRITRAQSGSTDLLPENWATHSEMIHETMNVIVDSIRAKDFAALHARLPHNAQKQLTVEKINERMKGLLTINVTGNPIANRTPYFRNVTEPGSPLKFVGHYVVGSSVLKFVLSYTQENAEWKPIGWNVSIKPIAQPT